MRRPRFSKPSGTIFFPCEELVFKFQTLLEFIYNEHPQQVGMEVIHVPVSTINKLINADAIGLNVNIATAAQHSKITFEDIKLFRNCGAIKNGGTNYIIENNKSLKTMEEMTEMNNETRANGAVKPPDWVKGEFKKIAIEVVRQQQLKDGLMKAAVDAWNKKQPLEGRPKFPLNADEHLLYVRSWTANLRMEGKVDIGKDGCFFVVDPKKVKKTIRALKKKVKKSTNKNEFEEGVELGLLYGSEAAWFIQKMESKYPQLAENKTHRQVFAKALLKGLNLTTVFTAMAELL